MRWERFESPEALSARAAELFLSQIRENPRAVLGLPTGRTPIGMYSRVVQECTKLEIECQLLRTDAPLDVAMMAYLEKRSAI